MRNKRGEEKVRRKKKEVITHAKKEEEGKQQTGRKGREKSRVKKRVGEKFSCGEAQMRKPEGVNDWAGGSWDGNKPFLF